MKLSSQHLTTWASHSPGWNILGGWNHFPQKKWPHFSSFGRVVQKFCLHDTHRSQVLSGDNTTLCQWSNSSQPFCTCRVRNLVRTVRIGGGSLWTVKRKVCDLREDESVLELSSLPCMCAAHQQEWLAPDVSLLGLNSKNINFTHHKIVMNGTNKGGRRRWNPHLITWTGHSSLNRLPEQRFRIPVPSHDRTPLL